MSTISIVMMLLFMAIIWGGLLFALQRMYRVPETDASHRLREQPEDDEWS